MASGECGGSSLSCRVARAQRRWRLVSVGLLVSALLVALPASAVRAATIMVNVATDSYNAGGCATSGAGQCTLRDAVAYGNDHPGTTVDIQVGSLTLTIPPDATNDIGTGDLNVLARMTITSTRSGAQFGFYPRVDATGLHDRILTVTGPITLTLSRVSLVGGTARATDPKGGAISIDSAGTVNGSDCILGGTVDVSAAASFTLALGGAIYNAGTLSLTNCTITGHALGGSSIVSSGNGNATALGGGIYNRGIATITGCTFESSSAVGGAGTVDVRTGDGQIGGGALGGAIYSSERAD